MLVTPTEEYSRALSALEGVEFQEEVTVRLASMILDFQPIPPRPHGDGGLDGLSHKGTVGYCCYGLEHNSFKTNPSREKAVIKKFGADLRRLFELESKDGTLLHKPTPELSTILAPGQQLRHVKLIANWFDSHRVLGPIAAKLEDYTRSSQCRYIRKDASAVVLGPGELATQYAVDEVTVLRVRQRAFARRIHEAAETLDIADPVNFDTKIQALRRIRPDQVPAIDKLADGWRADWRTALAFEGELDTTAPNLHQALEQARLQIATRVATLMLSTSQPWAELAKAEEIARSMLYTQFGKMYESILPDISSGEVARLVGECPIGWQHQ